MSNSDETGGPSKSLEQLVKRATDETLTADNWQYILDVCDSISLNPESNTKKAIKLIAQRLALRDANVILRTLSLLLAVAENCGSRMKQEIATKQFIQDSLVKKLGDRKLHKQVKIKVAEVVQQLHRSFQSDPSLKPMTDAYNVVNTQYRQYLSTSSAPGPDKPAKNHMTKQDKLNEEQELERALKVSLQEYEQEQSIKKSYLNNKPLPQHNPEQLQQQQQQEEFLPPQPVLQSNKSSDAVGTNPAVNDKPAQTIATVSKVRALYDLVSYEPDELSFRKGDVITVIESVYRDWWRGSLSSGKTGIFPLNYVTPVVTKSPQELQQEQAIENKILAVDARKVDKLLALLSSNPENANEDEITQLYNEIIPMRPTVAKSIDKYSVRREELSALHQQLNSEVKSYNELVDSSISRRHSSQPGAGSTPQFAPPGHTGLPYQQGQMPSQPSYGRSSVDELQQQPTSAGFGNSSAYPQSQAFFSGGAPPATTFNQSAPSQPYSQPQNSQHLQSQNSQSQQHSQPRPQEYPPQPYPSYPPTHFSNVQTFPEVNNL